MNSCSKDWIDVLTACGTPLIATIVAWIAYKDWQTSEKARRRELVDRYAETYYLLSKAIRLVSRDCDVKGEALDFFSKASDQAKLFLSDEIFEYVELLANKAYRVATLNVLLKNMQVSEDKVNKEHEKIQLIRSLSEEKSHQPFRKYTALD